MSHRFTIVGLGEAIFDILPDAQHPGGAPLNVAVHAHQLSQKHGGRGVIVTRTGQDDLGKQLNEYITSRQMDTTYVQSDPDLGTGRVYVQVDDQGQPTYDIIQNVAWDVIQYDPDLDELAHKCDAVCFGSLAQRHPQSRQTIYRFLSEAKHAVRLFDVNLRGNFYESCVLRRSCEQATIVKLNQDELPIICNELGLDASSDTTADTTGDKASDDQQAACAELLKVFELKMVILTRGSKGTLLITPQGIHQGEQVSYPAAENADPVGAGDACSAAVLAGLAMRRSPDKLVQLANHAGAYVASQPGATPTFPQEILNMLG